jgi:DNA-binding HxlR family transcriptional regulator
LRREKEPFLVKKLEELTEPNILDSHCPAHKTLELIADKWTVLVVALLMKGDFRDGQLKKEIGGISQKMLTQTLRHLEQHGFVTRTVFPSIPPRVDYSLTPLGRSLGEPICALGKWAETHMQEVVRATLQAEHEQNESKTAHSVPVVAAK